LPLLYSHICRLLGPCYKTGERKPFRPAQSKPTLAVRVNSPDALPQVSTKHNKNRTQRPSRKRPGKYDQAYHWFPSLPFQQFFGVFGFAARPRLSPPASVLSWNRLLVQSSHPSGYRLIGLASPLCRWSIYPGCVGFPRRASLVAIKLPVEPSLRVPPSSRVLPSVT
jgi:hypothetical protein